ncbi:hypothetical protein Poli38472_005547 [Pythium oligandrum]|uniref:CAP-Gly domain-containing protein n=1 Tax=Pythium oligandrum TaxID=41045 RepID=A0A8K1CH36_PYTOL|nr:hypothetical protein Poli38472_005547 [Pythium oligandrum]|eukprot:TMW62929.1 hypothetical protein Poli38472_005547 [Pythium oligandrum]
MSMELELGGRVTYGVSGKTGVVRYVGEVETLSGEWVGIELDKPEGKHNGELNGKVYFTCPPNHGVFVRKTQVKPLNARTPAGSPTPRSAASTRARLAGASASSTTASRLQQMRDRRVSGVGVGTGMASERRSYAVGLGGSAASTRSTASTAAPSPVVSSTSRLSTSGAATPPPSGPPSVRRTPSATSTASSGATTPSRLPLDPAARRPLLNRRPSLSTPSDDLMEARARIAKLEEELEDRNRHVEQLNQNLTALRESHERVGTESRGETPTEPAPTPMEVEDSGETDESVWLEKIEEVRQEAEEHVRNVRAELEDFIAQLQSEHEELVDELRLENATQSSEIKSLEAEVAQQKSRIAQFTTAEQKKAEEVAHAVAKTSAGARKVEALEAQLAEFQEMIETLTLDKETLEMDKEIAEEHVEELQAEMEKLKSSIALASSAAERVVSSTSATELAEENMKLRAAVKALHDRGAEEKNELNKKLRQLQRENVELVALREEVEILTTKRIKLEGEVEELKELLDVANAYESMVEDLTEKNLTLGEKVADLETSVISLEALKEMSEEMEHQHVEYEGELNREIESLRASIQELKNEAADQKTTVDDRDRTIARFRDAMNRSREEINQLKAQLRAETGELESLKGTAHSALNQTMTLRVLAASARENEAEAAKQKINAEQARLENAFLRAAVPSSIFSEMDQKVLRVRLRLGRIAGKADILLQYLKKDLDGLTQQEQQEEGAATVIDSERTIQQFLLGEKLATLSCQAKEDLFVLDCHLTTAEEYNITCGRLDTNQVGLLEAALDSGLIAFADGSLFVSRSGEASVYNRLLSTLDEWRSSQQTMEQATEGFPMRCAVVKFRSRKSVMTLMFSFAMMVTYMNTMKGFVQSPDVQIASEAKQALTNVLSTIIEDFGGLLKVAQQLHRRGEMDLAWSDEDLDGSVAVGGDVVELMYAYAAECQTLWSVIQEQLSVSKLQAGASDELMAFADQSLLSMLTSLKDRLASIFKSVCRGAFTDAVTSRSRDRIDMPETREGRPQWQIRAQAIHNELLNAAGMRVSLNEANELCQALHTRVRELERADSQHRVVAQKLESEILRLNGEVSQTTSEKTRLEEQLGREREQFHITLDESHKEKAALDNLNRELRKQLKRSSDVGLNISSSSSRGKSALNQGDADAFRKAFEHLHGELHRARATLAKERMDRVLGPLVPTRPEVVATPSDKLVKCAKEVSKFSAHVKTQLSMPRMVDLTKTTASARSQLVTKQLEHAKMRQTLADLRSRLSAAVREDGWSGDVVSAISRGENVFGWRPPEMERPPVLLGRVTLRPPVDKDAMEDISSGSPQPVQLVLNQSQVQQLTQRLVC